MSEILSGTIEEELSKKGSFAACAIGESMRPMLRGGCDMVVIEPCREKIKKYDVILFKDKVGRYVLHRVIKLKKDLFITRGDNTYFVERVPSDKVLGILTRYNKNGKSYDVKSFNCRFYARRRVLFYPFRKAGLSIKRALARLYRKIFKRGKNDV